MTVPTKILHSTTAGNKPASLLSGQLAINEQDRALYYLDPNISGPSDLIGQLGGLSASMNLAINGGLGVDQGNIRTAVAGATGITQYAIDMAKITTAGVQVISTQQVSDAPPGLFNSLKFSVTTGNGSPGSTDICGFQFPIEGYRIRRLGFGAVGAL